MVRRTSIRCDKCEGGVPRSAATLAVLLDGLILRIHIPSPQ
jgi:hypothetical protein